MEATQTQKAILETGEKNGSPTALRLVDLPDFKLGKTEDDPFHATNEKWVEFASTFFDLTGTDVGFWTWEMRRDLLNWMLEEGIVVIEEGRLLPHESLREVGDDPRTPAEAVGVGED